MNIIKKSENSKKITVITFIVITILQLTNIIYSFMFLKEDFHSDEQWSYGLANSYYEPYIYQDADETEYKYLDQWTSSEVFHNYMTVQKGEQFNYGSVFYNQSKDLHPPLFYMVLHTICSFFPDKLSYMYGYSINIATFIITQIFLFLLIKSLTDSDATSLAGCILYGFSVGALNTFIFIRMYAMCTMWCVILSYLHSEMYKKDDLKKYLPFIFIITLAGALTHHFFLAFAGCLSACFCFYYLFSKKIKKLIVYAAIQLSSVGVSILIFPATINHLFGRRGSITKYTYSWQNKISINLVISELFGFNISIYDSPKIIIFLIITACIIAIAAPLIFLFRNEKWFHTFLENLKKFISKILISTKKNIIDINISFLAITLSAIFVIFTTAYTVSAIHMANTMDRYMFMIFPIICVSTVCIINKLISSSKKYLNNFIIILISCCLCINSNFKTPKKYLWTKSSETTNCSEIISNSNCIYISNEYWLLTCLADRFMNCRSIYPSTTNSFFDEISNIENIDNDSEIYLLINVDALKEDEESESESESETEILINDMPHQNINENLITKNDFENYIKGLSIYSDLEYIGYDTIFARKFYIYELKR